MIKREIKLIAKRNSLIDNQSEDIATRVTQFVVIYMCTSEKEKTLTKEWIFACIRTTILCCFLAVTKSTKVRLYILCILSPFTHWYYIGVGFRFTILGGPIMIWYWWAKKITSSSKIQSNQWPISVSNAWCSGKARILCHNMTYEVTLNAKPEAVYIWTVTANPEG